MKTPESFDEQGGKENEKQTESNRKRNCKNVEVFLENFGSFIMMMSSLTFDRVSVLRKREREQRLRICKITTVKGKRQKYKNKQSETGRKDYLKIFGI